MSIENNLISLVRELIENLGAHINKIEAGEADGIVTVSVESDNNALLIGKEGECLRAITHIARTIAEKNELPITFRVDIGGFEKELKQKHEREARMYAERARHTKGTIDVPASDSFTRRNMHNFIALNYPDLSTQSEGEGRERHLVIRQKNN